MTTLLCDCRHPQTTHNPETGECGVIRWQNGGQCDCAKFLPSILMKDEGKNTHQNGDTKEKTNE